MPILRQLVYTKASGQPVHLPRLKEVPKVAARKITPKSAQHHAPHSAHP
jgi:hypothetical protein